MATTNSRESVRTKLAEARRKLHKCRTQIEGHEALLNEMVHEEKRLAEEVERLEVELVKSDDASSG
jgi:chromosome segregation ATPase